MNVVDAIAARHAILTALVKAGPAGLDEDELRDKVSTFDDTTFKRALKRLAEGGLGTDGREIYRKDDCWHTWRTVAPKPLTLGTMVEEPPQRDPDLVAEDEQFAREQQEALAAPEEPSMPKQDVRAEVLGLLKKPAWFSTPQIVAECSAGAGRALKALVAEKLVIVHGKRRATRYSLKAHQLEPLATTGAAAKPARAKPRAEARLTNQRGGGASSDGSLTKTIAQLEAELEANTKRGAQLKAAIEGLKAYAAAA